MTGRWREETTFGEFSGPNSHKQRIFQNESLMKMALNLSQHVGNRSKPIEIWRDHLKVGVSSGGRFASGRVPTTIPLWSSQTTNNATTAKEKLAEISPASHDHKLVARCTTRHTPKVPRLSTQSIVGCATDNIALSAWALEDRVTHSHRRTQRGRRRGGLRLSCRVLGVVRLRVWHRSRWPARALHTSCTTRAGLDIDLATHPHARRYDGQVAVLRLHMEKVVVELVTNIRTSACIKRALLQHVVALARFFGRRCVGLPVSAADARPFHSQSRSPSALAAHCSTSSLSRLPSDLTVRKLPSR